MRTSCLSMFLLVLAGCGHTVTPGGKGNETPVAAGPIPVEVVHPVKQAVRYAIEQPGRIQAFEETPIHVKIPGYVEKVHVDIGDEVQGPQFDDQGRLIKPGQLLAELFVPEMVEAVRQKQAEEELARAQVKQAESALKAAEAGIEAAKALVTEAEAGCARTVADRLRWTSEHERIARLVKDKAVDEQLLDESLNRRKSAEAACQELDARIKSLQAARVEAEARRDQAQANLGVATARLSVAGAEVRQCQTLLDYSKVRAPFTGIITARHIDTGHFLKPEKNGEQSALFVIVRNDPVRVFIDVPEVDAQRIDKQTTARLRVQALDNAEFTGTVTRTAWGLDHQSHTLRTEIDLPNPEGRLRPGMYVYAVLAIDRGQVFTLPATAVATEGNDSICYLIKDGKAVRTTIRAATGRFDKDVVTSHYQDAEGKWLPWTGTEDVIARIPTELKNGAAVAAKENK
ncbi:MAG: efflux RND transporter periplasmic adaptor subunit [Gemmataceae bacterium]